MRTLLISNRFQLKNLDLTIGKPLLWPLLYSSAAIVGLYDYINLFSVNFVLGVTALCLLYKTDSGKRHTNAYALVSVCFGVLCLLLPVKTLLYGMVICSCCFALSLSGITINRLFPLIACCMSSVFQYIADIFGFPIRLALTDCAAKLVSLCGYPVTAQGNVLIINGNQFSVDAACMGLNMLAASILLGIMSIAIYEKQFAKQLRWWQVAALLSVCILFNIFANLLRIVCLVLFKIPAESAYHSVAGLLCLAVYGFAPALFVCKFFIKKYSGDAPFASLTPSFIYPKKLAYLNIFFLVIIASCAVKIFSKTSYVSSDIYPVDTVPGYRLTVLPNNVTKLQNKQALVYIKSVQGFYSTDHNPSICWRGSGYEFKRIQTNVSHQITYYSAILQKGNEQLYTAWWYDNGSMATISQLAWRWSEMHEGRPFSIVNITTASQNELLIYVNKTLQERTFNKVILR